MKNQPEPFHTALYDSARQKFLAVEEFRSVFRYRDLIYQLVRRDLVTRYKRSALGFLWTMLNPLLTMLILSVVFSQVFSMGGKYPAYVITNLIAWNFFSQTTTASMNAMLWGSNFFQKIYLPRTSFVISTIGTGMVNTVLAMVPLFLIFFITQVPLKFSFLLFPVPLILLALFSLGFSLILSTFVVFFPDVAEMFPIVLTAWMYLTPVILPEEILNKILGGWILHLNPIYPLIKVFRMLVFDGDIPTPMDFGIASAIAIGTFLVGWLFFTSQSKSFAYYV